MQCLKNFNSREKGFSLFVFGHAMHLEESLFPNRGLNLALSNEQSLLWTNREFPGKCF